MADRIESLDALRGAAVIGILAMNIGSFALPPAVYGYPAVTRTPGTADVIVWAADFVLIDGKMRALFSMLFGASLLLVADRAGAAGRDPRRVHLARMAWLLVIGVAHALLVWSGDILTLYAVVGTIAFAFHRQDAGALLIAGLLCLAAQAAIFAVDIAGLVALRDAAAAADAPKAIAAAWRAMTNAIGPGDGSATRAAIAIARSDYAAILADRLRAAPGAFRDQFEVAGLETLGFMLIGMAALRGDALTDWPARRLRRLGGAAIAIGLAGGGGLLALCLASRLDPLTVYAATTLGGAPLRPLLAVGYAALALAAWRSRAPARLVAAGRMALSNYIGASVVGTILFYGYGFALYARLGRAALLLPVAAIAALILWWSPRWLARFRHGPLEWLWRSLARGQLQAMRKSLANTSQ